MAPPPTPSLALSPRIRTSPFFDRTMAAGCSQFTIYNHMYMPTSYGDPEAEYWRLIEAVSLWDVSVQRQVELRGPDAGILAQTLTPRNLVNFGPDRGRYVPICDHDGGMLNDPVLLKLAEDRFWFSIADKDLRLWTEALAHERGLEVQVSEPDVSPLALQGPRADDVAAALFGDWVRELKFFSFRQTELEGIPLALARSGWSKQGGFELYLMDGSQGARLWDLIFEAGRPFGIGPGAPNSVERIESALLSYGADMDRSVNPFEVGMGKYVDVAQRADFIGKAALTRIAGQGPARRLVGLFIDGPALPHNLRRWIVLQDGRPAGYVSSAVHSIRLQRNIAMALMPTELAEPATGLSVLTEAGEHPANVTTLPFL